MFLDFTPKQCDGFGLLFVDCQRRHISLKNRAVSCSCRCLVVRLAIGLRLGSGRRFICVFLFVPIRTRLTRRSLVFCWIVGVAVRFEVVSDLVYELPDFRRRAVTPPPVRDAYQRCPSRSCAGGLVEEIREYPPFSRP